MTITVGFGKKLSLEDLVKVAVYKVSVSSEEKHDSKKADEVTIVDVLHDHQLSLARKGYICKMVVRAGLLALLTSILQDKANPANSICPVLIAMLNDDLIPALSSTTTAATELSEILCGRGKLISKESDALMDSDYGLSVKGFAISELSKDIVDHISAHPFLNIGLGCLVAAAGVNLIRVIDGISALSCEAIGCSAQAFDGVFEVSRPQRGFMQSAYNIRLLLDGSKRINTLQDGKDHNLGSVYTAPQSTGSCRDILSFAAK
jgi:histidine ammonia-lyase